MVFIGYICDFFTWLWKKVLPIKIFDYPLLEDGTPDYKGSWNFSNEYLWIRIMVLILALAAFVFFAALYMDSGLGVSPCDAIPFMIQQKIKKLPIKVVRIMYDAALILIAFAFGSKWYIATILMALTLGPVIEFVGKNINKWFSF